MRGRQKVCDSAARDDGQDHESPCVNLAHTGRDVSVLACFIGTSVLYIEADLPESYPSEATPDFSLSNINNSHLSAQTKEAILKGLLDQVSREYLHGCSPMLPLPWQKPFLGLISYIGKIAEQLALGQRVPQVPAMYDYANSERMLTPNDPDCCAHLSAFVAV